MIFRAAWAWHSRSPILFIATAEPNLCPVDTPQSLDLWEPWTSHTHTRTISWKDWEKVAWEWCWWVVPRPQAPYSSGEHHASALSGITINYCHH